MNLAAPEISPLEAVKPVTRLKVSIPPSAEENDNGTVQREAGVVSCGLDVVYLYSLIAERYRRNPLSVSPDKGSNKALVNGLAEDIRTMVMVNRSYLNLNNSGERTPDDVTRAGTLIQEVIQRYNKTPHKDQETAEQVLFISDDISMLQLKEKLGLIIHDINNPLTTLNGNVQLFLRKEFMPIDELFDLLNRQLATLSDRTSKVGERIEGGFSKDRVSPLRIAQVFEGRPAELLRSAGINTQVVLETATENIGFTWNEGQMEDFLSNLARNTRDEVERGSNAQLARLVISRSEDGQKVRVFFMDDGKDGFPETTNFIDPVTNSGAYRKHVTTKVEGNGIGCALHSDIISEVFKGKVTIHNGRYADKLPEGLKAGEELKGAITKIELTV